MTNTHKTRLPRTLRIIGLVLVLAGAIGVVKVLTSSAAPKRGEQPVPVAVVTVRPMSFIDEVEAIGTARSNEAVTITAKVTETVRRVAFGDGQLVQAGDVLVELTNAEQAASLQSARTGLDEAQRNLDRVMNLQGGGYASRAQIDAARTARDNAKSRVDTVMAQLSDRLIRAPFSGILGLRQVSPGGLVRPGDVITTLDDVSVIKLDFVVPETYLGSLAVGMPIKARAAAYGERTFSGTIEAIDSRVDPVTRAVTVRAMIPNPDNTLRSGMLLTLDVIRDTKTALAVPERAVVALGQRLFVYRIDEGRSVQAPVAVGARQDGMVEIASGLEGGERIVTDGVHKLRQGQKIDIVEADGKAIAPLKKPRAGS